MEKLTQEEIDRRMVQWRNDRTLEPVRQKRMQELEDRCTYLEAELARERKEREDTVEALKLQIEELCEMVYGRKRGKKNDDDNDAPMSDEKEVAPPTDKTPRSPGSYRRATPTQEDITEEKHYGIDACPQCGESLTHLREAVRYLEDIVIPALAGLKIVTKQTIETGFCPSCRQWRSAIPIGKQVCSLGENVRMRIAFSLTVLQLSYEKIRSDLQSTFGMEVSDGEIAHIQTVEAVKLLPEYHAIDARIEASPCKHFDETTWDVQSGGEGNHGWVKTATDTFDALFRLGRSRGKGNATILRGEKSQPAVTDDCAVYDNLFEKHGLCWAHPKRKFQDLAESGTLTKKRRRHCQDFYGRFCALMTDVKAARMEPYDRERRAEAACRLQPRFAPLCLPNAADPKKLATLKKTFLQNTEKYLLCVLEKDVPMTNNKAERSIRPLVTKRKISFGSKTQKGADVMSILMSVCFSTWWKCPKTFYQAYGEIVRKWQV